MSLALALALGIGPLAALALPGVALADAAAGKTLFEQKNCQGCHTLNGKGGQVGPDLTRAGAVPGHDRAWHLRHLKAPGEVTPGSFMPPVSDPEEAAHLADYLVTLTGAPPAPVPAPATAAPAGDAGGAAPPQAGAAAAPASDAAPAAPADTVPWPPSAADTAAVARGQLVYAHKGCQGCHSLRGTGGNLGPDLTFEGEVAGHDADWHRRHLRAPSRVTPGSPMPPFDLPPQPMSDLVAYLLSLKRLAADMALTPELQDRYVALGMRLEALKVRVEHAKHRGRNVDDLGVGMSEAWTHVGAVEEMLRNHAVTGAGAEIGKGEQGAERLDGALGEFERQLARRDHFILFAVGMLLIASLLITLKVRLLVREWWLEQETSGSTSGPLPKAPPNPLPPGSGS